MSALFFDFGGSDPLDLSILNPHPITRTKVAWIGQVVCAICAAIHLYRYTIDVSYSTSAIGVTLNGISCHRAAHTTGNSGKIPAPALTNLVTDNCTGDTANDGTGGVAACRCLCTNNFNIRDAAILHGGCWRG